MKIEEKHFGPVWFIPGETRGKYPYCHSIYIEGSGVLIDPASDPDRLLELRNEHGVSQVWLSHAHEDHFKYLGLFDDVPLALSEPDAPVMADVERLLDAYGVDGETRGYWREFLIEGFDFRPRTASKILKPGEVIDLGTVTVEIIATPGHTPGHLAFFFREPEVLFLADYDLSKFGPWYGDLMSSIEDTIDSIIRLRRQPARIWLTSHETGLFEENPGALWDDYLEVIRVREEKLLNFLEEPRTFEEIVQACIVYWKPREPKEFFELGERGHMSKHLEKLIKAGRAVQKGDQFVRIR